MLAAPRKYRQKKKSGGGFWRKSELFSMRTRLSRVSPRPSPRWGEATISVQPLAAMVSSWFTRGVPPPTSVGFVHSHGHPLTWIWLRSASRPCSPKNLPRRSRENRFTHGFTHGRVHRSVSEAEGSKRVPRVREPG